MIRKIYLLFMFTSFVMCAHAQEGIEFDAHIDVDFLNVDEVQVPASPIKTQVLFSGTADTVTYVDFYGDSVGFSPAKENHDFIGITPDGDDYWITVNHERTDRNEESGDGGGMTAFKVSRGADDTFEVIETSVSGRTGMYHNVDFVNTVGETWTNCGGIIAPDGRIWTAEEYPKMEMWGQGNQSVMDFLKDTGDVVIGEGIIIPFNSDNSLEAYRGERLRKFENQGWMVEIDPVTAKAIRKQYNWGRMSFEAGAITDDMTTVYLAEDERPGLFTKFVADDPGDFTSGTLYVYKQDGGDAGNWLEVPSDLPTLTTLKDWAWENGATYFIRLEWVTIVDGMVYIAETGYDNVAKDPHWTGAIDLSPADNPVAYHHVERATAQGTAFDTTGTEDMPYYDYYGRILKYDPIEDTIFSFLEGGPEYALDSSQAIIDYPAIHLSNPDGLGKITIEGKDYLIINEDLNGSSHNRLPSNTTGWFCEMYALDLSIAEPTINDLVRLAVGPTGAELTGGNGLQNGKAILVNVQHPSSANAYPYNHATTVALNGITTIEDMHFEIDWEKDSVFQSKNEVGITPETAFINDSTQIWTGETLKRYESQGWMVEIDPVTAKAIRKQYNWGRMSFEAGAISDDMTTVYLLEDERPGLFTKFVADVPGDFTTGTLYVYKQSGGTIGNWLEVPGDDFETMVKFKEWAWENGATYFIRLEWVTIVNGKVYMAETGYDNVAKDPHWTGAINLSPEDNPVAYHHVERAADQGTAFDTTGAADMPYYDYYGRILVYDPVEDTITTHLEGGPAFGEKASQAIAEYPSKHLSNPDGLGKITIGSTDYLVINEDLNGASYNRLPSDATGWFCEMYLLDVSIAEPTIDDLIRIMVGPNGSELTGGNGTQDGESILVDIQHPGGSNDAPFNHASTVALTGWENMADVTTANFDVDFKKDSVAQYTPAEEITFQVLFSGTVDSVTYVDTYGNPVDGMTPAREDHDFIGITQVNTDTFMISVNHESRELNSMLGDGGGMTVFSVERRNDSLIVFETMLADGRSGKFHNVDFANTVGETWTNCGGIIAPDGRIWTAEEYPRVEAWGQGNDDIKGFISNMNDVVIGSGVQATLTQPIFSGTVDMVQTVDFYGQPDGVAPSKENHDFIGISQLNENEYILSINHETRQKDMKIGDGGAMTSFKVIYDGQMNVVSHELEDGREGKFFNVDFVNTVGETWTNCGGIIAPDGRIWTAEEYPRIESWGQGNQDLTGFLSDTGDVIIGSGIMVPFNEDNSLEAYKGDTLQKFENQGWMVEIDPATAKAIRKQYNWGRMSFEAGAISEDMTTVYLAEDERPGIFTKFVADEAGDFTSGTLYAFKQDGGDEGNWIEIPSDLDNMVHMKQYAWENGATFFIRLEWVTIIDGIVYIAETGYDNICKDAEWVEAIGISPVNPVAAHHITRAEEQETQFTVNDETHYYDYYGRILAYDPESDEVSVYLEGGPDYAEKESQAIADYPGKHLSNPDGIGQITVNGRTYMIINEDLNGSSYNRLPSDAAGWSCEMYLLDMGIENPTVDDLTRIMVGPNGAELTGGNGTPDGKSILVDVQHPSMSNTPPYNHAVTVALTGFDFYDPQTDKEIISFEFEELSIAGTISGTDITAEVPYGTNVTALVPTIEVSPMATVAPESGVAQDFTNSFTYTVTAEDESTQDYEVTVTIGPNAVVNNPADTRFDMYPNPAVGYLYFNDKFDVAIYDMTGNLVKTKYNTDVINISELPAGIYYVKNQNDEVKKLIVK